MRKSIKSFLKGMGSVLVIFPEPMEYPLQSDEEALRSDWLAVGEDIEKAKNLLWENTKSRVKRFSTFS